DGKTAITGNRCLASREHSGRECQQIQTVDSLGGKSQTPEKSLRGHGVPLCAPADQGDAGDHSQIGSFWEKPSPGHLHGHAGWTPRTGNRPEPGTGSFHSAHAAVGCDRDSRGGQRAV
ncbi:MAG: hypothetical protein, partial [Olavius algarvensis Delta 4 endosymbiont]